MTVARWVRSDGRTVIMGAVVIATILAAGRGIPAIVRWQRSSIQASRAELRARRNDAGLASRLPVLRDRRRGVGALTAGLDSVEITAPTAVAAGARLMNVINELAQDAGVEVSSARLDERDREQSRRAAIGVQLDGGLEDLVVFLSTLEAGPPAMAVTDFSITSANGPTSVSATGKLQAAMTVAVPVRWKAP